MLEQLVFYYFVKIFYLFFAIAPLLSILSLGVIAMLIVYTNRIQSLISQMGWSDYIHLALPILLVLIFSFKPVIPVYASSIFLRLLALTVTSVTYIICWTTINQSLSLKPLIDPSKLFLALLWFFLLSFFTSCHAWVTNGVVQLMALILVLLLSYIPVVFQGIIKNNALVISAIKSLVVGLFFVIIYSSFLPPPDLSFSLKMAFSIFLSAIIGLKYSDIGKIYPKLILVPYAIILILYPSATMLLLTLFSFFTISSELKDSQKTSYFLLFIYYLPIFSLPFLIK